MAKFQYIAKSFGGKTKKGQIEAKDLKELAQLLKSQGYILISANLSKKRKFPFPLPFLKRVSLSEKLMFTRNLEVMIRSGISLPQAISTLSKQTKNKFLKKALVQIEDEILKGKNFSETLKEYPSIFPNLYCSMIGVGEKTGTLSESLKILAFHLDRSFKIRSKVKSALMYPAVVVGAMIVIGIIMLINVIPKLSEAFENLEIELPKSTKFVINFGNLLAQNWYILTIILVSLPLLFIFLNKNKKTKKFLDRILLKLPLFSGLIKKINTAYTARTLSSLISGGVSIVEALEITSSSVSNYYFQQSLLFAKEEVKKGKKLSSILENFLWLYPPVFVEMIRVGEETGQTSEILSQLAEFLEEEVTNATQNLASVIEPILLLLIGGVIAFFAISMIRPIYSMMGAL